MLDRFKILTVTHKRINLNEIGHFVVKSPEHSLRVRLEEIKEQFKFEEFMYLATCNRVLYFFLTERELDEVFAVEFFKHLNPTLDDQYLEAISETAYFFSGMEALEHLFEVAGSIDSLVIGERQILGQMRTAYEECREWGLTGDSIRLAMDAAVQSAKRVYSHTRIGDKPVSVVSLAIQKLLQAHLPKEARILVIGAGETNQLVAKFLAKHHYHRVSVFNRTLSKAEKLANILEGADALPLEALAHYSEGFDAMFVCTGATEPIILPDLYRNLLAGETDPKLVIDLAIPNNVHEEVVENFAVNYVEIEGLRHLAKENMAFREQEVLHARNLLAQYVAEFPATYRRRQLELALREVPDQIKAVKTKAMNEVFRKEVDLLDDATRELMERMMTYMEKKCIGIPMKAARQVKL